MPNWCYTKITITNDNKEENNVFKNLMDVWTKIDYMENGFRWTGNYGWLGNIVLGANIGTVDTDPKTDLRCRGSLSEWEYDDRYGEFTFWTETAWSPMLQMWVKLIEKYMPHANMLFVAEECGCGMWDTNDHDLVGKYIIDGYENLPINIDNVNEQEMSKSELEYILRELLKDETSAFNDLIEMFEESEFSDEATIHQWEYVDIEVYC